jgi:hypothetical protein
VSINKMQSLVKISVLKSRCTVRAACDWRGVCAQISSIQNWWVTKFSFKNINKTDGIKCLLLKRRVNKFNLIKMAFIFRLYSHTPLKNLVWHNAANFLLFLVSSEGSVIVTEFQTTDACLVPDWTRVL